VELALEGCAELTEPALREHIELELPTLSLEGVEARLVVRCGGGGAEIEVQNADGAYPIRARVELGETAKAARERLVALAATELLAQAERARTARSAVAPRRAAPPPPPPPREPARDTGPEPESHSRSSARSVELFAAGSAARHGVPKTTLWGGSLGTLIGFGRRWSLLFDTRFERGTAALELADVRWSVLSGFAGAAARVDVGSLRMTAGLGARAGWLALDARARTPHDGLSLTAPWAGVALPLRFSTALAGRVVPFVGGELGFVLLPVRGDLDASGALTELMEQRGPWFSASAGLGVVL
jgi:hypothetical protein